MEELLAGFVELLYTNARLALWSLTESGRDYIDDHQADDEAGLDIPVDADEMVALLRDGLTGALEVRFLAQALLKRSVK